MKKIILTLASATILSGVANAQTIAHWDYQPPDGQTRDFTVDSLSDPDCTTAFSTIVGIGFSGQDNGSEGTTRTNCFAGWDDTVNSGKYVSYQMTFANDAVGSIDAFNFDGLRYDSDEDPREFVLEWYVDSVLIGSFDSSSVSGEALLLNTWTDFVVPVSGINFTDGTSSSVEFRLHAYDIAGTSSPDSGFPPRIGLDNIRIMGDVSCGSVPEPSSTALLVLSTLGLLARRKR